MKMRNGYAVSTDGYPGEDYTFFNKDDRNEMLLALYQEMVYDIWMRLLNWYDINDVKEAESLALEHLFIYDTVIVEE